jgi:hypothetical protein
MRVRARVILTFLVLLVRCDGPSVIGRVVPASDAYYHR